MRSGGPSADYKVKCDSSGEILVSQLVYSGDSSFSNIVSKARTAGFSNSNADYTIFADANISGACGIGSFYPSSTLSVDNRNNSGGAYGVTYLACWNTATPMHENGHNQGAVQSAAPHSTGTGAHCWDEHDVMCYSPDGGDRHQQGTEVFSACADQIQFDCRYDDYFDAAPESGEYLNSNWNMGSRLNRFIQFGLNTSTATNKVTAARQIALRFENGLHGRVLSGESICLTRSPVRLYRTRDGQRKLIATKQPNQDGTYYFDRHRRGRYQTRVASFSAGDLTCAAAKSSSVRVR